MAKLAGKRIAVGGFMHETNTFQPQKTTYADFAEAGDRQPLVRGPGVLETFEGTNQSIAGSLSVLRAAGATLLPLLWTSTTPSGSSRCSQTIAPCRLRQIPSTGSAPRKSSSIIAAIRSKASSVT